MNILGIIPARKGSKGILNKNTKELCGKPMIQYTIEEAFKSKFLNKIVVSTNDPKVQEISTLTGVDVIIQPEHISLDDSPTYFVIPFVIKELKKLDYHPDIVVLMRITTPLRTSNDIDGCIEKLIKTNASSVISVVKLEGIHPLRMKVINDDDFLLPYEKDEGDIPMQRQKLPPIYMRNGGVYASTIETINKGGMFGSSSRPYIMPSERSVNINEEIDFLLAETLLRDKIKSGQP